VLKYLAALIISQVDLTVKSIAPFGDDLCHGAGEEKSLERN